MSGEPHRPNVVGLLVLIALGWFVFGLFNQSSSKPVPKPAPEPSPAISSEMDSASEQADRLLKRHLRDVIDKLERGELTDERQCRDLLAAGVKASRDAAWAEIKAADVAAFADGWTPQKQIERLKAMIGEPVNDQR